MRNQAAGASPASRSVKNQTSAGGERPVGIPPVKSRPAPCMMPLVASVTTMAGMPNSTTPMPLKRPTPMPIASTSGTAQ